MDEATFEVFVGSEGEFRFRLKDGNGRVLAVSRSYSARANCLNDIYTVRTGAPGAEVVELADSLDSP